MGIIFSIHDPFFYSKVSKASVVYEAAYSSKKAGVGLLCYYSHFSIRRKLTVFAIFPA